MGLTENILQSLSKDELNLSKKRPSVERIRKRKRFTI
jgi:hypothetical protein